MALDAIDAAIRAFNPNRNPENLAERRAAPALTAGVTLIQRFLLDLMRRSGKPLRTLEATSAMMASGVLISPTE